MPLVLANMTHSVEWFRSSTTAYQVEIGRDWRAAFSSWDATARSQASPFQRAPWFDAWYEAHARQPEIKPLVASVRDRASGELALVLPLIEKTQQGLRVAEFADLNLTDYNAPVLGAAAPRDPENALALWRALCAGLDGIDFVQLRKMPIAIGERPNPLAILPGTSPCQLNGNIVVTGEDFEAYRYSLERTVRKELERSWRVFTRHSGAGFRAISDPAEALQVLAVMESQQSTRMHELGRDYALNEDTASSFYRNLIVAGLPAGYVVMTALTCGEDIVAALLGIRDGERYLMIRISNAGATWSNCSPGRLIIQRTMAHLHVQGCRQFDFSIGSYGYKRRFGVTSIPLVDKTAALTWRGIPRIAREGAIQLLRRYPGLEDSVRRRIGKPRQHVDT